MGPSETEECHQLFGLDLGHVLHLEIRMDFHLYPLSFDSYVNKRPHITEMLKR